MEFSFEKTIEEVMNRVTQSIAHHKELVTFAKQRAKFEGWVKVELCGILKEILGNDLQVKLEKYYKLHKVHIDIVFKGSDNKDYAIEIKTINTSYRYPDVIKKTCPITENIKGLISDIGKLKNLKKSNSINDGAVLFVVFPVEPNNPYWKSHYENIKEGGTKNLNLKYNEFRFFGTAIPGVVYVGLI